MPVVAIEHVGSTAVPRLAAKPVIDCDIRGRSGRRARGLRSAGRPRLPTLWRTPAAPAVGIQGTRRGLAGTNTYVVVDGCLSLRSHLAVRNVLPSDPVLRNKYAAVKRGVGASAADIDEYGRGKNATIQRILAAAELTEAERASIGANLSHECPTCCRTGCCRNGPDELPEGTGSRRGLGMRLKDIVYVASASCSPASREPS
jgi:GrpB-like predicted nucleotidyltransferase (UPF0157 family)